ncbi:HlyD family type I secretion periplasmic adaptor subunit [Devosia sp. SL43]|uniref:HlyD family type I secretion periplasmic adaptor subunit n=1 Tax=Devosia sp. SL43 TaxID=2806348 RepID=UPI001EFF8A14|nr:HlyD family type I secretion periplasmic adaptor subunit [Devosia sp. SL43]UJW85360.1 HlyD family type I secretion periplasmic adaptor subunit [Devosia sp. SL43]
MVELAPDYTALRHRVTDFSATTRLGGLVIGAFMAVFGVWTVVAPISGAVIAPGIVVTDGRTQMLRYDRGGVIAAINVAEGDRVAAGDVIAVMSPEAEKAALGQLTARLAVLDVTLARLAAERDGQDFPADLTTRFAGYDAGLVTSVIAGQQAEHAQRAVRRAADQSVIAAQRQALVEDRAGLVGERDALLSQSASLAEDLALRRAAAADGYGRAAQLRELEREDARIAGSLARLDGQLNSVDEQLAEMDARLASLDATFAQDVAMELAKLGAERLELSDQLEAATVAVDRVEVRADQPGIVDKLHVNTVGSAVEPYAVIAEIVPDDQPVLIEAKVAPIEIDDIAVGQMADIVFSGLSRKDDAPLEAEVVFVSPDSHVDERTGARYFTVRLDLSREALAGLPPTGPGMAVETYFRKPNHTLLQYLLAPLTDSFGKAFR